MEGAVMKLELETYKEVEKWGSMEEGLKKLARKCDLYALGKKMDKAPEYWLSRFIPLNKNVGYAGNFLHLAVWHGNGSSIEAVMKRLPEELVRLMLCQQEIAGKLQGWNPLHVAVYQDEYILLEKIVNWPPPPPTDDDDEFTFPGPGGFKECPKEALEARDSQSRTPALLAIHLKNKRCAEILTTGERAELIQGVVDHQDNSPLFLAITNHLDGVVSNLLDCPAASLCGTGPNGFTALHIAPRLSFSWSKYNNEAYKKLFGKLQGLVYAREEGNGFTVLHRWITICCESWDTLSYRQHYMKEMYKCFFEEFPKDAVRLMFETDNDGNNPIHHTTTFSSEDAAISIAQHLTALYKSAMQLLEQTTKLKPSGDQEVALEAPTWLQHHHHGPWLEKNKHGDTPLLSAIRNKRENLALWLLEVDPYDSLYFSRDQDNPFILAVYNGCYKFAKQILVLIAEHHQDLVSLVTFDDGPVATKLSHHALIYPSTFIEQVKEKLAQLGQASKIMPAAVLKQVMRETFEHESWAEMDTKLREAACSGHIDFLQSAIASSKPPSYWLSRFKPPFPSEGGHDNNIPYAGNILHLAIWHEKKDFVTKAISSLSKEVVHLLLSHQETAGQLSNRNPLHLVVVTWKGDYLVHSMTELDSEVVSMLRKKQGLARLKACPDEITKAKDSQGKTPALLAVEERDSSSAECQTSKDRAKLIQDIVDHQCRSPLFVAVLNGLDGVVMNILNGRAPTLCCTGPNGLTALHVAPGLFSIYSDKRWHEVNTKLFEKLKEHITVTDGIGFTVLHRWVEMMSTTDKLNSRGEELFKWFFESYPDKAVELVLKGDIDNGNNPLHHMVTYPSQDVVTAIAEQLIGLCKTHGKVVAKTTDQPWLMKNKNGDTPFVSAIRSNRHKLGECLLSADPVGSLCIADQINPFLLAAYHRNYPAGRAILAAIQKYDLKQLLPFDDECPDNILELAYLCPTTFIEEVIDKLLSERARELNLGEFTLGRHSEYKVLNVESWGEMEEELKEAACAGNESILKDAPTAKLWSYWLCRFIPITKDDAPYAGNIFHIAAWHGRNDFVIKAFEDLPKEVLRMLIYQQQTAGVLNNWNPLHVAVFRKNHTLVEQIANRYFSDKLFTAQDGKGMTPALLAVNLRDPLSAKALTCKNKVDLVKDSLDNDGNSILFLAVKNGLHEVVANLVDTQGSLPATGPNGLTALHVAPGLSDDRENQDEIYERLFGKFPDLTTKPDKDGFTLLHKWVEMSCNTENKASPKGLKRLFKYYFDKHRADAITFMLEPEWKDGNSPLHVVAASSSSNPTTFSESMAVKIAVQLVDLYKRSVAESPNLVQNQDQPWLKKNNNGHTPFILAIHHKLQDLALCFLQQDAKNLLKASGDDQQNPLILAAQNKCYRLVKEILGIIAADKSLTSLLAFSDKSNILHLALDSGHPEMIVKEVVKNFPMLINESDGDDDTPLDKASKSGADWAVELMLKKEPLSLEKSNNGWKVACEKGHVRVVLCFLRHCSYFRGFCLGRRDSPLHYIKRPGYAEYQNFLGIHKVLEELTNIQDDWGNTPLQKAINNNNIHLAEALLTMKDVRVDVKNKVGKTAMDLLVHKSKHRDWKLMCTRVEIDPTRQMTYVQRRADLLKIREVVIVVAALLATITFQAGFTLPGGLDNNTGEALLARKAVFLVFLLADVVAMCCSILVLFCLIWSMFSDSSRSTMIFIDRSMLILLISLFASLVAFMAGVFLVISEKALWAAIITIVSCSLVGISAADKGILYVLLKKMPAPKTENGPLYDIFSFVGKACTSRKQDANTNGPHLPL